jgi:hypothetical protein
VHWALREQEPGSMRKTIAGLLVLGLVAVVFFALNSKVQNNEIIIQYIQLVGVIIAFYFGSKATSDAYKGATDESNVDDIGVKKVTYLPDGKLKIKVSNNKGSAFEVRKVVIKDGNNIVFEGPAMGSGSSSKEDVDVFANAGSEGDKNKIKNAITTCSTKDLDITIETNIGSKSAKCKIMEGTQEDV